MSYTYGMSTETVYVNNPSGPFGEHSTVIALNGWSVVNVPRPLPGMVTWTGDFRHGIFYAAGPVGEFQERWQSLDAWPVQAITNLQIVERVKAECDARGCTLVEILDSFDGSWDELATACGYPWRTA